MISELLPALKQFQDSGPCQPRLAAAQALLCTQGSCIFNFTVQGVFFLPFSTCHRKWSGSMTANGKLLPAITRKTFLTIKNCLFMHSVSLGAAGRTPTDPVCPCARDTDQGGSGGVPARLCLWMLRLFAALSVWIFSEPPML